MWMDTNRRPLLPYSGQLVIALAYWDTMYIGRVTEDGTKVIPTDPDVQLYIRKEILASSVVQVKVFEEPRVRPSSVKPMLASA